METAPGYRGMELSDQPPKGLDCQQGHRSYQGYCLCLVADSSHKPSGWAAVIHNWLLHGVIPSEGPTVWPRGPGASGLGEGALVLLRMAASGASGWPVMGGGLTQIVRSLREAQLVPSGSHGEAASGSGRGSPWLRF